LISSKIVHKKQAPLQKRIAASQHQRFAQSSNYVACIEKADTVKVTKLVKTCEDAQAD
jgi:hypothetical protein